MSTVLLSSGTAKATRSRTFGQGLIEEQGPPPVLEIKGTRYTHQSLPGDEGETVVRLVKLAGRGEVYDVSRTGHGVECTCPDWTFKRADTGRPCKHIVAVEAAGLLPEVPKPKSPNFGDSPASDRIASALTFLADQGYGPVRLAKVEAALRLNVEVGVYSVAIDRADRDAVRSILARHTAPSAPPKPAPKPRPTSPAPSPVGPKGDIISDDVVWSPEAVAKFMAAERARQAEAPAVAPYFGDIWGDPRADLDAMNSAWNLAFDLARDGIAAEPCREWETSTRLAFLQGRSWGEVAREGDLQAEADEQDARAESYAEELAESGLPYFVAECYA